MEYVSKDDFEKLEERVSTHTEKLAQCKLQQHIQDHDTLTVLSENNRYAIDKMKRICDIQEHLDGANKEMAGQLNLLADKVMLLNNGECARKKWIMGIFAGIIIAVLAGLFMLWINFTIRSMSGGIMDNTDDKIELILRKMNEIEKMGKGK